MYLPWSTPIETVFDFAYAALPVLHNISDARVRRISVRYSHLIDSPAEPPAGADIQRKLLLLLGDGTYFEAIMLYAPKTSIIESSGPYAGIRLDMSSPVVQDFATSFPTWSIPLLTEDGLPIGPDLVTGGIAL
jgi:hypothetical protein